MTQYYMINTTEGEPVAVVSQGSMDHGEFVWTEGCHVVNEIVHIQILGRNIIFMNRERHEFAVLTCQDHAEAKAYALANFGWICVFDDSIPSEESN